VRGGCEPDGALLASRAADGVKFQFAQGGSEMARQDREGFFEKVAFGFGFVDEEVLGGAVRQLGEEAGGKGRLKRQAGISRPGTARPRARASDWRRLGGRWLERGCVREGTSRMPANSGRGRLTGGRNSRRLA
jgi:hypothetical protein